MTDLPTPHTVPAPWETAPPAQAASPSLARLLTDLRRQQPAGMPGDVTVAGTVYGHAELVLAREQALVPEAREYAERAVRDRAARTISQPVRDALRRFLSTPGLTSGNPYVVRSALHRLDDDVNAWHAQLAAAAHLTVHEVKR